MRGLNVPCWRVRHDPGGGLLLVGPGEQLLIGPLPTVCEVEAVLRLLASEPQVVGVDAMENGEFIARFQGRRRLRIMSDLSSVELVALLTEARSAQISDDRAPGRRRFEIKGMIRNFAH